MVPAIESECWPFSHRNGGLFPAGMVVGFNRNTHLDEGQEQCALIDADAEMQRMDIESYFPPLYTYEELMG